MSDNFNSIFEYFEEIEKELSKLPREIFVYKELLIDIMYGSDFVNYSITSNTNFKILESRILKIENSQNTYKRRVYNLKTQEYEFKEYRNVKDFIL